MIEFKGDLTIQQFISYYGDEVLYHHFDTLNANTIVYMVESLYEPEHMSEWFIERLNMAHSESGRNESESMNVSCFMRAFVKHLDVAYASSLSGCMYHFHDSSYSSPSDVYAYVYDFETAVYSTNDDGVIAQWLHGCGHVATSYRRKLYLDNIKV